ncbi:unnamed protein product [Cuscuta epithymum]|uniref:Transposase MuDR plant domain-containing protein n=1 Tax=Cuscuta epithymum TaxID=186058 RepID=A0AAV0GJT8_9ASTE|nr:unnamed protein product [Cuscuta epithymum]
MENVNLIVDGLDYIYNDVPTGYVSDMEDDNEGELQEVSDDEEFELNEIFTEGNELLHNRNNYGAESDEIHFRLGMTFGNAKEARSAIANYSIAKGVQLKIDPKEPQRIRARCMNEVNCPFNLYISKDGKNPDLAVKTLVNEHKCYRHYSLSIASASWLAKYFKDRIYQCPKYTAKMMKHDAEKELKINAEKELKINAQSILLLTNVKGLKDLLFKSWMGHLK